MCQHAVSRWGFFQRMTLGSLAGASILELAIRRAASAQAIVPASIKALQTDGYGEAVRGGRDEAAMQAAVNTNIEHVFNALQSIREKR
jgi:hypothetical protein